MRRNYQGISINTSKNTHETVFGLVDKNKGASIIDIPAGSGAFVKRLKDSGYSNVAAVDIENILEIEHENFVQADMTLELPFSNNSYDALVCIDGIEHISRQFDFVKEVHRILKPGGAIIISTPNISSIRSRWKWLWTGHHHKCVSPLDETNPTPLHHVGMISFAELRYLLHTQGFKVEKIKTNRIKIISLLYAILVPFIYLSTIYVYLRKGKKEGTLKINKEVIKQVFTKEILFGETMIVKAQKRIIT